MSIFIFGIFWCDFELYHYYLKIKTFRKVTPHSTEKKFPEISNVGDQLLLFSYRYGTGRLTRRTARVVVRVA